MCSPALWVTTQISEVPMRMTIDRNAPAPLYVLSRQGASPFVRLHKPHSSKLWGFLWGFLRSTKPETRWYEMGEPPCRASPSGRPGRTRRGDKVGFRFRLHGRSTSPSRQSPQVERESDQSTRKRPSPTQQFATNPSPDSRSRGARSGEWRQVLTQPHRAA